MNDWKKQAAQVMDSGNVEKAFLDQSFTFVANKVKDLMNPPYCLGFEIIHKNDSNTRMVAIFAFKAGGQLLYVPVFFLNGEIKGQDLMYQVQRKAFVPSDEWADYYLQMETTTEGEGQDKNISRQQDRGMDLERLRYPYTKGASVADIRIGLAKEAAESLNIELMEEQREIKPVLRDFLEQESPEFVEKLALAVEEDFEFASDIHNIYEDLGRVIPEMKGREKEASSFEPEGFEVFTGLDEHVKSASDQEDLTRDIYTKGYAIKDFRKRAMNVVYEESEECMETVGEPGFYNVSLLSEGNKKGLCAPEDCDMLQPEHSGEKPSPNVSGTYDEEQDDIINTPEMVVVYEDGSVSPPRQGLLGEWIETCEKFDSPLRAEKPVKNKTYRIFDIKSGKVSKTFKVMSRKKRSGITVLEVVTNYCSDPFEIRYNPKLSESSYKENIFGEGIIFLNVAADVSVTNPGEEYSDYSVTDKEGPTPADNGDIRSMLKSHGAKSASVRCQDGFFQFSFNESRWTDRFEKLGMVMALSSYLDIPVESAEHITKEAEAREFTSYDFGVIPPMEKAGSRIALEDQPEFITAMNSRFGIEQDFPQHLVVNTTRDEEEFPDPRIGDAWDPSMGQGGQPHEGEGLPMDLLMSAPPQEIAQMAGSAGMPQVFDHGIVGSMVHTYDAVGLVDKWLPKLEASLDAMGRMVFLYYWKPGDFQDAYGLDDMEELENQLLSNFRSMGEMVMNLLKKSSRRLDGPTPLKKSE